MATYNLDGPNRIVEYLGGDSAVEQMLSGRYHRFVSLVGQRVGQEVPAPGEDDGVYPRGLAAFTLCSTCTGVVHASGIVQPILGMASREYLMARRTLVAEQVSGPASWDESCSSVIVKSGTLAAAGVVDWGLMQGSMAPDIVMAVPRVLSEPGAGGAGKSEEHALRLAAAMFNGLTELAIQKITAMS